MKEEKDTLFVLFDMDEHLFYTDALFERWSDNISPMFFDKQELKNLFSSNSHMLLERITESFGNLSHKEMGDRVFIVPVIENTDLPEDIVYDWDKVFTLNEFYEENIGHAL